MIQSKQTLIYQLVTQQARLCQQALLPLFPLYTNKHQCDALQLFIQKTFAIHMNPRLIRAVNKILSGKHYLAVDPQWLSEQATQAAYHVMQQILPLFVPKLLLFLFTDLVRQHCLARLYPNTHEEHSLHYIRTYLTAYYVLLEKHLCQSLRAITQSIPKEVIPQLVNMTTSTAASFDQHMAQIEVDLPRYALRETRSMLD